MVLAVPWLFFGALSVLGEGRLISGFFFKTFRPSSCVAASLLVIVASNHVWRARGVDTSSNYYYPGTTVLLLVILPQTKTFAEKWFAFNVSDL